MELADLNLLTYVIRLDSGRYYSTRDGKRQNWTRPHSTDILAEANIYNDLAHARRVCKKFSKDTTVHPVSKKVFFEATLKGDR